MKTKITRREFLRGSVAGVATFCLSAGMNTISGAAGTETIVFVHTNDVHGHVDVEPYVKSVADTYKSEYGESNVYTVSAGDVFAGGEVIAHLTNGESIVEIMNAAGYDAMAVGNNDIPNGLEELISHDEATDFPIICANLVTNGKDPSLGEDQETPLDPYVIFTTESGVKIGVFGLTTVYSPPTTDDTPFEKLATIETAEKYVVELKEDEACDIIIALAHTGWPDNDDTYTAVSANDSNSYQVAMEVPGIDLIIDGHTHSIIGEGQGFTCDNESNTLIVQAGCFGDNIGVVMLEVNTESKAIESKNALQMVAEEYMAEYEADPAVAAIVNQWQNYIDDWMGEVVGYTEYDLVGERGEAAEDGMGIRLAEQNLGNLITDAIRYATGAEISWFSGVRIRASIAAGDIKLLDYYNVFANGGDVVQVTLTGAEIKEYLASYISEAAKGQESPGFRQVSGIYFVYNSNGEIVSVTLEDGSELSDESTYVVAGEFGVSPENSELLFSGDRELVEMLQNYMDSEAFDSSLYEGKQGRITKIE